MLGLDYYIRLKNFHCDEQPLICSRLQLCCVAIEIMIICT